MAPVITDTTKHCSTSLMGHQHARRRNESYKKAVLGKSRARVAVEAAVELGWERYIGLEGRFVGMHDFGASGKIADVYKKFDINAEAVVRAAHETLAEVAAL
jgi:transketolase